VGNVGKGRKRKGRGWMGVVGNPQSAFRNP
jgi:hypothetical protein